MVAVTVAWRRTDDTVGFTRATTVAAALAWIVASITGVEDEGRCPQAKTTNSTAKIVAAITTLVIVYLLSHLIQAANALDSADLGQVEEPQDYVAVRDIPH